MQNDTSGFQSDKDLVGGVYGKSAENGGKRARTIARMGKKRGNNGKR